MINISKCDWLEALEPAEMAKIADAAQRILVRVGVRQAVRAEICTMRSTASSHVERLHIILYFERGSIPSPRCEVVWVDDYELAFLLIDDL